MARAALGVLLASHAVGLAVTAQGAPEVPRGLVVSSTLERIAAAPDADAAASGTEHVIVSVRFTNLGDHVVDSIRITSPVPAGAQYVPHSAGGPGADVLFSVDGGGSFGRPDELAFAGADGSVRAAEPADYTHVRWVLRAPLDAGATGIARFRAVPR